MHSDPYLLFMVGSQQTKEIWDTDIPVAIVMILISIAGIITSALAICYIQKNERLIAFIKFCFHIALAIMIVFHLFTIYFAVCILKPFCLHTDIYISHQILAAFRESAKPAIVAIFHLITLTRSTQFFVMAEFPGFYRFLSFPYCLGLLVLFNAPTMFCIGQEPLTDLNNSTFIYTGFFFDTNYYAQNIIIVAYTPYRLASTFEVVVKYTCILALLVDIFTLKRYSAYAAYDNGNQKHADVKYALQMITLHALSLAVLFEEVWGNIIFGIFDDLSMFAAWELFPEIWLLITGMVIVYYNHPESKKRRRRESKKPNGIPIAVFSLYQKSPMVDFR
ncbi:unnamed protein product, partial [Mesorhabditis spiculigera]